LLDPREFLFQTKLKLKAGDGQGEEAKKRKDAKIPSTKKETNK
jgi:hypothetical protein